MEDEYEVGEHYRTKNGGIFKIIDLDDYGFLVDKFYYQIVKHSKNIIDLIEIEDVVKVKDHDWIRIFNIDDEDILESFIEDCNENNWTLLSIVTHEQFASIEHKVEEDK